jgi:hypothetical protein
MRILAENPGIPDIPIWLLLLGLEFPAITAMIDCVYRPREHFEGGKDGQRAWRGWLIVAIITVPVLFGFLILVGYYYAVVRRNSPHSTD